LRKKSHTLWRENKFISRNNIFFQREKVFPTPLFNFPKFCKEQKEMEILQKIRGVISRLDHALAHANEAKPPVTPIFYEERIAEAIAVLRGVLNDPKHSEFDLDYEILECVICSGQIEHKRKPDGEVYWTEGNNAEPIEDGRCCESCNSSVVIPARLEQLRGGVQ
jgi:hypothetical protein